MSSDSEIDDLQSFEDSKQRKLARKAGIDINQKYADDFSDEEVLGLHSDNDSDASQGQDDYYEQDDDAIAEKRNRTNRKLDHNWGATRDNYFGGEDDIGEDEGASDEEEEEALRLRAQELEDMGESDFVDENDLEGWKATGEDLDLEVPESYKPIDPSLMSVDERKELLHEKFPAVLLLSSELEKFDQWEAELRDEALKPQDLVEVGRAALNTYKGMIYTFFALFNDRLNNHDIKGLAELEEHPVNEGLLTARQLWLNYCNIGSVNRPNGNASSEVYASKLKSSASENVSVSDEEISDAAGGQVGGDFSDFSGSESEGGYALHDATDNTSESNSDDDNFSIAHPKQSIQKNVSRSKAIGDFDETADTIEQQARAKNKQSLRFYTSQIGKNDRSKQNSYSGDIDLPYKEREFERRQRLLADAKKRGQQAKDVFSGDEDNSSDEIERADSNDVYSKIKEERENAKQIKTQRHLDAVEAARSDRVAEYLAENPDIDKRAITYQIEKNKGLTKHRKKENRNARVKKRLRYEAAQKKLKGVRKVYKESQGPYQGELTGIRKNLSHSSKFKN